MLLCNKAFELIQNDKGLAENSTRMIFNHTSNPYEATYSGPNVSNGHVLIFNNDENLNMVYHALTSEGQLVAGKATVNLAYTDDNRLKMELNWQWLTGDQSSGISKWIETSI